MQNRLKLIKTPYVDAQTLLNFLGDYRQPRDCILGMVRKGDLIRLKNGIYLISERIQSERGLKIPYEQVANFLYGPSYVSLEWALSFYGMIPERVHTITSMTLGRKKEFHTSVGDFFYHPLSAKRYSIGITQKDAAGFVGGFLIASPEKALADIVFVSCKGLSKDQLRQELLESKRIDREVFRQLNRNLLFEIGKSYRAKTVNHLIDLVTAL